MASEEQLLAALDQSWSAFTTYHRQFNPYDETRRRLGQDGATALLIQDFLGGKILSQVVHLPDGERTTHFYNEIDNRHIDPTRMQYAFYGKGVDFEPPVEVERAVFDKAHYIMPAYYILRRQVAVYLDDASPVVK